MPDDASSQAQGADPDLQSQTSQPPPLRTLDSFQTFAPCERVPFSGNLSAVRTGLTAIAYGQNLFIIGAILFFVLTIWDAYFDPLAAETSFLLLAIAGIFAGLGCISCYLGLLFCTKLPAGTELRLYLLMSIALLTAGVIGCIACLISMLDQNALQFHVFMTQGAASLVSVTALSGPFVFVLFLGNLCVLVEHKELVKVAVATLVSLLIVAAFPVCGFGIGLLVPLERGVTQVPEGVQAAANSLLNFVMYISIFGGVGTFVFLSYLLHELRKHLNQPQFQ